MRFITCIDGFVCFPIFRATWTHPTLLHCSTVWPTRLSSLTRFERTLIHPPLHSSCLPHSRPRPRAERHRRDVPRLVLLPVDGPLGAHAVPGGLVLHAGPRQARRLLLDRLLLHGRLEPAHAESVRHGHLLPARQLGHDAVHARLVLRRHGARSADRPVHAGLLLSGGRVERHANRVSHRSLLRRGRVRDGRVPDRRVLPGDGPVDAHGVHARPLLRDRGALDRDGQLVRLLRPGFLWCSVCAFSLFCVACCRFSFRLSPIASWLIVDCLLVAKSFVIMRSVHSCLDVEAAA